MIPKSGGDYAYINVAFGPLAAFLYLWMALLILVPTGNAITALTFAQYLLQPFWPTCDAPIESVRLFAAIITCNYGVSSSFPSQFGFNGFDRMKIIALINYRCFNCNQLLQCEVGDTCDGHIYSDQNPCATIDCCIRCLAFSHRQYRILWRSDERIENRARFHCIGLLQWPVFIFRMELFEFRNWRAQRSIQVRLRSRRSKSVFWFFPHHPNQT